MDVTALRLPCSKDFFRAHLHLHITIALNSKHAFSCVLHQCMIKCKPQWIVVPFILHGISAYTNSSGQWTHTTIYHNAYAELKKKGSAFLCNICQSIQNEWAGLMHKKSVAGMCVNWPQSVNGPLMQNIYPAYPVPFYLLNWNCSCQRKLFQTHSSLNVFEIEAVWHMRKVIKDFVLGHIIPHPI